MLVYVRALINMVFRRLGTENLPDSGLLLGPIVVAYVRAQVRVRFEPTPDPVIQPVC